MTEVLQQAIIVMLEKIENLNKDNKGIQLYIHKFKNLQTRRGLTLLSQLCRDPAVGVRNAEEA